MADQNKNWDLADKILKNLDTPTFEDYTGSTAVPSATDAIDQIKSKGKLGALLANIKAAFKGACLIGHIVNNCVTDNAGLPLSAAQGKVLMDKYTQLYSELGEIHTNVNKMSNGLFAGLYRTTDLNDIENMPLTSFSVRMFSSDAKGVPVGNSGVVFTYKADHNIYAVQLSFTLLNNEIYVRYKNESWSAWRKI